MFIEFLGCRGRFEAVLEIWHDVSRPVLRASERAPNGPFVCSQCFETDGRTEQLPADGPSMWQNFLEVSKSSPFTGPVHAAQCEQAPESAKPLVAGRTIAAAAIAGLLKNLLMRFFRRVQRTKSIILNQAVKSLKCILDIQLSFDSNISKSRHKCLNN